jgi:hypothetical protein
LVVSLGRTTTLLCYVPYLIVLANLNPVPVDPSSPDFDFLIFNANTRGCPWRLVVPAAMLRRVTPPGPFLRLRAGATGSLACRPRRTFSATRSRHATHYDTLSIPRNASKSQIKVSSF